MVFDNVNVYNMSVWPIKDGYLCQNFKGYAVNSNVVPNCFEKNFVATKLENTWFEQKSKKRG